MMSSMETDKYECSLKCTFTYVRIRIQTRQNHFYVILVWVYTYIRARTRNPSHDIKKLLPYSCICERSLSRLKLRSHYYAQIRARHRRTTKMSRTTSRTQLSRTPDFKVYLDHIFRPNIVFIGLFDTKL